MEPGRLDAGVLSEAAAWLARLRSDERTGADELGLQAWLAESEDHRRAFDVVNTAWETAGGLRRELPVASSFGAARRRKPPVAALAAAVALVVCAAGGLMAWMAQQGRVESYTTAVGEQRRIALADGSTMILDTDTAAQVRMKPRSRHVAVTHGRVHFDVAKDNSRPFAVKFGDRQVVAVGTAFDVANYGERASVVMTSGRVLLEAAGARRLISRGERLSFNGNRFVQDQPDLDGLTAWQSGRALFDNQPLKDVVREMNRYSRRPIVLASADLGEMRVSGAYETSDLEGFAVSVATLLPLSVQPRPDRLVLARRR